MKVLLLMLIIAGNASAGPILQMNKAFNTLTELMPFILSEQKFKEKKNEALISKNLKDFETEFKIAGHDEVLKNDLFSPSYKMMVASVRESKTAFTQGKKDYALWMLRDSISTCLECHTRLPAEHTSSFQDGDIQIESGKYKDPYELGVTYLIVRRFVDAKEQFLRVIQDKLIRKEDFGYIKPFQQILMIELKVKKDPAAMISFLTPFLDKKITKEELRELNNWSQRLEVLKGEKFKSGIHNDKELKEFLSRRLEPIEGEFFDDKYKPDLLFASGILSVYFFQNPQTKSAPILNYWLGRIEAELRKDDFLSSADLFLKQCIKKYPLHPIAKKCLASLKDNNEFMYSGSRGTEIPPEVEAELKELELLIQRKKK
jgi:hypothetical protein